MREERLGVRDKKRQFGCRAGGMQDMRDGRQEGWNAEGRQDRRDGRPTFKGKKLKYLKNRPNLQCCIQFLYTYSNTPVHIGLRREKKLLPMYPSLLGSGLHTILLSKEQLLDM